MFDLVNPRLVALMRSPLGGRALGRWLTVVTYTGRRSGRRISTPVGYRRSGDVVTIPVGMADRKNWWRNFTGTGGPVSVLLDGVERGGHAVADRNARGRADVRVQLSANP